MNNDPTAEDGAQALAKLVRAGAMPLENLSPARREAVRKYLEVPAPRQFFAQQNADRLQFFREWQANGHTFHRVSKADHAHIFGKLVQDVDAGVKTAVWSWS